MFRKIAWAVQDFFEFDLPEFIDRVRIIDRMRAAEAGVDCLLHENDVLREALTFGASEYGKAVEALREIASSVSSVNTPNGTTRKIGRIANETLDSLLTIQVEKAFEELEAGA